VIDGLVGFDLVVGFVVGVDYLGALERDISPVSAAGLGS
jgi:hypothetical protein